ncbi:LysM peptidoglycan-binding domain-containing protein [Abyssisolibacter fermentans]|uniref:LysM peptidoglycan-binding domain-containing protein n=1 Tax=Abyssisolibacter fermentans TaxID=1766203 RepID=UPI00083629CE|nr:LysM peptidoglycan-binding domain-containing protein [Abyssisolibacter fermentans]
MNKIGRCFVSGVLALMLMSSSSNVFASYYTVKSGDTFWKIAGKYNMSTVKLMQANEADESRILYVGDVLYIPDEIYDVYYVKAGDTPWLISKEFNVSLTELLEINNLSEYDYIYIGQKLKIPSENSNLNNVNSEPYITYKTHIVQKGDDYWKLSVEYGVSYQELLDANGATYNSILYIGDEVKIPVHNVPVMQTKGDEYGEYLDWWNGAQYVLPRGATFKVIDFYTGKSFMVKRTTGSNHADCETLTKADTNILKSIWGGFSWTRRPVIIEYNGRRIAASVSGMPHAGNDSAQGGAYTEWRSGEYGAGLNLDYVKNNDMDGVFDVHFLNSTRHKDGLVDSKHQECVKIAAGIK